MLVSNPMGSARVYRVPLLVIKRRPGRRESPVTKEGDRKAGRSAYMEQLASADSVSAIHLRTESMCIYLDVSMCIYLDRGTI